MKYVFAIIMIFVAIIVGVMFFSFLFNAAPPVLDATSRGSAQLGRDLGQAVNPNYYANRPAVSGPTTVQAPVLTTAPAPGSGTQKVVPSSPAVVPAAPQPKTGGSIPGACVPTQQLIVAVNAPDTGTMIEQLDELFNGNGGKAGVSSPKNALRIDNPGAIAIVWTNTFRKPIAVDAGKPVAENVFFLKGEGSSYGAFAVFAPATMPSPGRYLRGCDPVTDLQQAFPGAVPYNP